MKAKVIIEDGVTSIILSAENEFEKHIVDKVKENRNIESKTVEFYSDREFGNYHSNQKISIKIIDKK